MSKNESQVDIQKLGQLPVYTADNQMLPLGMTWKNQTVILIFLRHFACIGCRGHATQVWNDREKYEKSGSKIVFIGNGSADYINKFKEDLGLENALVLTDPSRETYKAAGFYDSFSYILKVKTLISGVKLFKQGHRQATYSKDAGTYWQLGGVLAINPRYQLLYHYISEYFGDTPDEPYLEIIKADESKISVTSSN